MLRECRAIYTGIGFSSDVKVVLGELWKAIEKLLEHPMVVDRGGCVAVGTVVVVAVTETYASG